MCRPAISTYSLILARLIIERAITHISKYPQTAQTVRNDRCEFNRLWANGLDELTKLINHPFNRQLYSIAIGNYINL